MSDYVIDHLSKLKSTTLHFPAGGALFRQGDTVVASHFVEKGTVHLQRFTADGAPVIMQRAGPGTLLAEASIFASSYHCDATAVEPVVTRQFDVREVRNLIHTDSAFAAAFARHLAEEVMRLRSRSELSAIRTVRHRLDAWLALPNHKLPPTGRRVELARELGVTPEALYRELARRNGQRRDPTSFRTPEA